jgi:DNA-binding beta-propeller fold protein YncE
LVSLPRAANVIGTPDPGPALAERRKRNMTNRDRRIGVILVGLFIGLGICHNMLEDAASAQARNAVQAPRFEVDPLWPKPLPNHWLLGSAIGVWVDERDHVWIIHRSSATLSNLEKSLELNPPVGECCAGAPPVLEFDPAGNLVRHWGGPGNGYEWPSSNHGITIDHKGVVWIGGNGDGDSHILKFTRDGKFLQQFGKMDARRGPPNQKGQPTFVGGSHDSENFGRVAKIFIDPKANEAYVADGYLNKRVAVIDADTGKLKRYWGAYGNKPDDANLGAYNPDAPPAQQFRNPVHCAELANDGLLYVCDRANDRIQVFTKEGKFVKETFIAKKTLRSGSTWDLAFSKDPKQAYIYVADGVNEKVHILQRDTLEVLTSFGDGGRQPSQFFGVHSIATDSKGNIYTTETYEGKRLQKFVFKGVGPVPRANQGAVWPRPTSQ